MNGPIVANAMARLIRWFTGILVCDGLTKVSLYIDDVAWKHFRDRVFARHGTLRRLSDEVEGLICSEDIESAVASGASKAGISWERGLTPSAIKKARPKLRGAAAETILRQMREQRHAGRLPRH